MSTQIVSEVKPDDHLSSTGRQRIVEAIEHLQEVKHLLAEMKDRDYKIIRARIKGAKLAEGELTIYQVTDAKRDIYQWPFMVASELASCLNDAEQYKETENEPTTQKAKAGKRKGAISIGEGNQATHQEAA